ncbi:MAG: ACP S-malonyltransferase [Actinomycetota bacterium]
MIAFLYPGQGSQHAGMGAAWRHHDSWELVVEASDITGRDIGHLLLEADDDELRETRNAQLATFTLSMVAFDALSRLGIETSGHAGHSLGEYSALAASGVLDFSDAVKLVQERGEAMQAAADEHHGTMAAIIGLDDDDVEAAVAEVDDCWVANYNTPGQVVIAGGPAGVEAGGEACKAAGAKRVMPLVVGGAFHTPHMSPAQERLDKALAQTEFRAPDHPVYANVNGTAQTTAEPWNDLLHDQLTGAVRWSRTLANMVDAGYATFVEIGPGTALAGMVKRVARSSSRLNVSTPADLDALLESLGGRDTSEPAEGEHLYVTERLVVSPCAGVFEPELAVSDGTIIETGAVLGTIGDTEVRSAFAGQLIEFLALPGERVQLAQPIAWLRSS